MSSPSKRRRTSPTTYIPTGDQENVKQFAKPTTPKRHLYQSPTRSSLARSHAKVLHEVEQAKQRRESASVRRQSLRDYILSKDPVTQVSQEVENQLEENNDEDNEIVAADEVSTSLARDIANVFKDVEPRASPVAHSAPVEIDSVINVVSLDTEEAEQPPPNIPTPRRRWKSPEMSPAIVPRLVQSSSKTNAERSRRSSSVELPPTPVELGKEPAPARPRGLLSSSPGGRSRRRVLKRDGPVGSSPLKPREVAPQLEVVGDAELLDDPSVNQLEIASGIGDEDERDDTESVAEMNRDELLRREVLNLPDVEDDVPPDDLEDSQDLDKGEVLNVDEQLAATVDNDDRNSQSEGDLDRANDDIRQDRASEMLSAGEEPDENSDDPVIQEKQSQMRSLQAQLRQLQSDLAGLERFAASLHKPTVPIAADAADASIDDNIDLLLNALPETTSHWPVRQEDVPLFKKHSAKYLTIFTPENLKMTYDCWPQGSPDAQRQVYQITLSAAQPFPGNTFDITLETTINLEDETVQEVVFLKNNHVPSVLSGWIEDRLQDPVMRYDLATIVTGIASYFSANLHRARTFRYLEQKLGDGEEVLPPVLDNPVTQEAEALALLPYLNCSTHSLSPGSTQQKRTRRSTGSIKQLMLVYNIELDWIGRANVKTDICANGFGTEVVKQAKTLYRQIEDIDGTLKAFEAVWKTMCMNEEAGEANTTKKAKAKARRMTVFD